MHRAAVVVVVGLVVGGLAASVTAKETSKEAFAFAAALAKEGKHEAAAEAFARAATLAQGERDLDTEQAAVSGLEEALAKTDVGEVRQRTLMAAAAALDPKRAGALVAARGLALRALFEATLSGSSAGVVEAAKILENGAKTGRAGATVAAYADAMQLTAVKVAVAAGLDARLAAKTRAEAAAALDKVSDAAFAERFDDLAFFAALEAAAQRLAASDVEGAKASFAKAARPFADGKDAWMSNAWRSVSSGRFAETPAEVTKALTDALGGTTSASGAGGRGGAGGIAGKDDTSPVARAMQKAGRKPVATVKRTASGWELGDAWSVEASRKHAFEDGFRMLESSEHSGLFWMVSGRSHTVSVRMIALKTTEGGSGDSSQPPLALPRWHLAEGETLSLLGDGTVLVSK